MVSTGQTWAFNANALRESLMDFITQIGYKKHPFSEIMGETNATSDRHEWNERGLAARASNRNFQGFNYSFGDVTAPTRRVNHTQILSKDVFVSRTAIRSNMAGISDLVADQTQVRLIELMNDIEWNCVNGTLITASSGASQTSDGAQMDGILSVLFTNSITSNTAASFQVSFINDAQDTLESRGLEATDVITVPALKKIISQATTSNTKFQPAEDRKIVEAISVYEGDFGTSEIRVSRDMAQGGFSEISTVDNTVVLDRSLWRKAWLDRPFMERVPKREDGVGAVMVAELTVEFGAATAGHLIQTDEP